MRKSLLRSGAPILLAAAMSGCGGARAAPPLAALPKAPPAPRAITPAERFQAALSEFERHDAARDWSDATCDRTARLFLAGGEARPALAHYNAGLTYQRCDRRAEARRLFEAAVALEADFAPARLALALTIAEDAVDRRDFVAARRLLGEARQIDDTSVRVLDRLARVHLAQATALPTPSTSSLELASTTLGHALAAAPRSAPVHTTLGLVQAAQRRYSSAIASFDRARQLDPSLYEAHISVGALHVRMRHFAEAELAFRDALRVRPDDYEGRLGLALALRGLLDELSEKAPEVARGHYKEAERVLEEAIKIEPARPEAYLSEGMLLVHRSFLGEREAPFKSMEKANVLFKRALEQAEATGASTPAFDSIKKLAKANLESLRGVLYCEFATSDRERKEREEQMIREAAEEEAN